MKKIEGKYLLVVPTLKVAKEAIRFYDLPDMVHVKTIEDIKKAGSDPSIGHATFVYIEKDPGSFPRIHHGPMCLIDGVFVWTLRHPRRFAGKKTLIEVAAAYCFTAKGERRWRAVQGKEFTTYACVDKATPKEENLEGLDVFFEKQEQPKEEKTEYPMKDVKDEHIASSSAGIVPDLARERVEPLDDMGVVISIGIDLQLPKEEDNIFQAREPNKQLGSNRFIEMGPGSVLKEALKNSWGEEREVLLHLCQALPLGILNALKDRITNIHTAPGYGRFSFYMENECVMFRGLFIASLKNMDKEKSVAKTLSYINATCDVLMLQALGDNEGTRYGFQCALDRGSKGLFAPIYCFVETLGVVNEPVAKAVEEEDEWTVVLDSRVLPIMVALSNSLQSAPHFFSEWEGIVFCDDLRCFAARTAVGVSTCLLRDAGIEESHFHLCVAHCVATAARSLAVEIGQCAYEADRIRRRLAPSA